MAMIRLTTSNSLTRALFGADVDIPPQIIFQRYKPSIASGPERSPVSEITIHRPVILCPIPSRRLWHPDKLSQGRAGRLPVSPPQPQQGSCGCPKFCRQERLNSSSCQALDFSRALPPSRCHFVSLTLKTHLVTMISFPGGTSLICIKM